MSHVVNVRMSDQDFDTFTAAAKSQGVPLSTCIRMLALNGLQAQSPRAQAESVLAAIESDVGLMLKLRRLFLLKM